MNKWKAASVYIAIWSVGAIGAVFLLPTGWAWLFLIVLWLWAVTNLVQVARGKRRQLWR